MTSMAMFCLLKVKIYVTLYTFSQYRSYTDFDIKKTVLYRYWLGLLNNNKIQQILVGVNMVIDVITD